MHAYINIVVLSSYTCKRAKTVDFLRYLGCKQAEAHVWLMQLPMPTQTLLLPLTPNVKPQASDKELIHPVWRAHNMKCRQNTHRIKSKPMPGTGVYKCACKHTSDVY